MPEIWIAAAIVVLDQATKAMVKARLPLHESVTVVPGFFDLTHVRNTGAAFGMLNNMNFAYKPAVMVLVALVALGAVASYALTLPATQRVARCGLALILGGAVGNLIDRAAMGYVVDFADLRTNINALACRLHDVQNACALRDNLDRGLVGFNFEK